MTMDILTPLADATVVELGNKLWRKQVLPLAEIMYEGRKVRFDEQYLRDVADAFRDRAHDTVPLVLAGPDNTHTMAAQAGRFGEAMGLEVDLAAVDPDTGKPAPGLYSTLRLSDEAEEIVRANPRFGVSLRIKHDYERQPDGRRFARAAQHVLGTWDPKIAGLSPWQQVELSNDPGTAVLDLSGLTYKEEGAVPDTDKKTPPASQDDAQMPAWFQAWLAGGAPGLPAAAAQTGDDTNQDDEPDDGETDDASTGATTDNGDVDDETFLAELDKLFPEDVEDPELVAASNQAGDGDGVDLANVARDERVAALELSNRQLAEKLDASQYEKERARLARVSGLPPAVIDLARPLLEGSGRTVELSNGDSVDAGEIVRAVLAKVGEVIQVLDLSGEIGAGVDLADDPDEAEKARAAKASAFVKQGIG